MAFHGVVRPPRRGGPPGLRRLQPPPTSRGESLLADVGGVGRAGEVEGAGHRGRLAGQLEVGALLVDLDLEGALELAAIEDRDVERSRLGDGTRPRARRAASSAEWS